DHRQREPRPQCGKLSLLDGDQTAEFGGVRLIVDRMSAPITGNGNRAHSAES
ncbi:hypothetical protein GR254_25090, partial [Mycobacterium tuberculosis]|nr:hypothetical protein [Mycobacterium tuberculosis]